MWEFYGVPCVDLIIFWNVGYFWFECLLFLSSLHVYHYCLDRQCAGTCCTCTSREMGTIARAFRQHLVARPLAVVSTLREVGLAPGNLGNSKGGGVCIPSEMGQ